MVSGPRTPSPRPRHPPQRAPAEFLFSLPAQPCCPRAHSLRVRSLRAAQVFPPPVPIHLPPISATESLRIPPSASAKSLRPRRSTSRFPRAARKSPASLLPLLRIPRPRPHRANPAPAPMTDSPVPGMPNHLLSLLSVSPAGFRMPPVATRHQSSQVRDGPHLPRQNFHRSLLRSALRPAPRVGARVGRVLRTNPFPSEVPAPELWQRCFLHGRRQREPRPISPLRSADRAEQTAFSKRRQPQLAALPVHPADRTRQRARSPECAPAWDQSSRTGKLHIHFEPA